MENRHSSGCLYIADFGGLTYSIWKDHLPARQLFDEVEYKNWRQA